MTTSASTSIAAFHASGPTILSVREEVLKIVESYGIDGCISENVLDVFTTMTGYKNSGTVTTRLSELERKGLVFRAGDKRAGKSKLMQFIWRHSKYATEVPVIEVKAKKNPFLAGMIFAAKIVSAESDLPTVKARLREELVKASKRSRLSA